MVWTAKHTQCRPMYRNMIFYHQRSLARQSYIFGPLSKFVFNVPINVLFMLQTCPLTRSDGFAIELFGVQNNSRNVVLTASKVLVVISANTVLTASKGVSGRYPVPEEKRNL